MAHKGCTLYGHSVVDVFCIMFQLSVTEVIKLFLFFVGVFASNSEYRMFIRPLLKRSIIEK